MGAPHFQAMPKPTQPKHACALRQTNLAKGLAAQQLRHSQDLPWPVVAKLHAADWVASQQPRA